MPRKKYRETAVEWTWRGDKNDWVIYDKETAALLEEEFTKGSKKVKVDKERFVDFSLSNADIIKHFNKIDHDDEVVGMQRRYDDEMKRRAIRRVVPQFFAKDVFLLLGKMEGEFTSDIEKYGGVISKKFTKKVTLVICEGEFDSFEEEAIQAQELKIPILSKDFVNDSVSGGKLVDMKKYKIKFEPKKKEDKKKEEKKPNKRKMEESDEEEDKKNGPKAAKKDEKNEVKKAEPKKEEKKEEKKAEKKAEEKKEDSEPEIEQYQDCPQLKRNTQWMGTCTMESSSETFPQVMVVQSRKGNNFAGEIHWPTLNSAKTKFRGMIKGDEIEHEEYEVITGVDDVVIPAKYQGKINGDNLAGKLVTDDEDLACTFSLNKLATPPAKELDVVKANAKFEGIAYQPFPFVFEVLSRKGSKVEATVTWPTLGNTKTKVRGTLEGEDFEFEEYESTTDEVIIPMKYLGRFIKNQIIGKFKGEEAQGNFEMSSK